MASTFFTLALAALTAAAAVRAESHTISFDNQCGKGTPQIVIGGQIVSNGEPWTTGSQAGIACLTVAWRRAGNCGLNGENCSLLEFNLNNPAPGCEGCGSSTDISLIDPHALNVPVAFEYVDGCNGQGNSCSTPDCAGAFHNPDDWQTQVACQTDNVRSRRTLPDECAYTNPRYRWASSSRSAQVAAAAPPRPPRLPPSPLPAVSPRFLRPRSPLQLLLPLPLLLPCHRRSLPLRHHPLRPRPLRRPPRPRPLRRLPRPRPPRRPPRPRLRRRLSRPRPPRHLPRPLHRLPPLPHPRPPRRRPPPSRHPVPKCHLRRA
ncbi:hypothetical protein BC834DRAFT_822858 [Gloeopeniophorella convolvens]|nr:hypothetical protein BC834DRAFT_822858 [Gloeopeniophorella convolvens]